MSVNAETLRAWIEEDKPIFILDVRPKEQRDEWQIPGSIYLDAYKRLNEGDTSVLDEISIPENTEVVTVCAAGRTSQIAATELRKRGIKASSLEGGMKGWSLAWNTAKLSFDNFEIIQLRRTGKGCLSYIIASHGEAAIVDASLSPEVYEQILGENNLTLKYVIETHIHADHLSRSKQIAERNNVPLYLPTPNKATFTFQSVKDETVFKVGDITVKAIHTPGHTLESTSYLVDEKALLTGDTLFIDGVGRPDLKADTDETTAKAKLLYQSLQALLSLPDDTIVLPAHTGKPVDFDHKPLQATLATIQKNVAMLQMSEEEFVSTLLQRIPATPANYLSIVEKNIKGDFSDINPVDLEAGANRCAIS
ncbi:MBL fold metallo-hydrolase [Panacibacter ginsenosidivorans]|uniref:MBL fold metallo-hydrolase n=2 Tax=Panacibacter ginsenosidivorans TaxID=1813871 RepID=A0A5B8VG85_9BACT|nr:MBL fold metallo-hydrolase [Panacibacter ginsenosidivorans]